MMVSPPLVGIRGSQMENALVDHARIGVVPYLNTLPLINGLDRLEGIDLQRRVPSQLIGLLQGGDVDVALCSSIDYQRSSHPVDILPVGMLGCGGETLTVRLFSRIPLDRVRTVACDTDSHTSVALLSIIFDRTWNQRIEVVPFDHATAGRIGADGPEAILLIGDKVMSNTLDQAVYEHQLDLGTAWAESTGMPFVFATWLCRRDVDEDVERRIRRAAMVLDRQRRHNDQRLERIAFQHSGDNGWDFEQANRYLGTLLEFDLGDAHVESLDFFYKEAFRIGLIEEVRPVRFHS